ncbi:MAG: hypothetical protein KAH57_06830 [Thermoplasmata archaeon]|nr:hypothetical protein [Thermoplasmata archaeon]
MPEEEVNQLCRCEHDETHTEESLWQPSTIPEKIHSPVQKKPYCKKCGKMKYLGSATAKKIGFYLNILAEIQKRSEILRKRGVKEMILTDVQKRVIVKFLESDEYFLDIFANNQYSQYEMFRKCVLNNSTIPPYLIDSVHGDLKG